jgi:hypothetical protein
MKLPAEGSARVNSATVKARRATARAAARMVSGAATPAVTAITPNPDQILLPVGFGTVISGARAGNGLR